MGDLKQYRFASSAAEAVSFLRRGPGRGAYIAGGTDLLRSDPSCDFLVDINHAGIGAIDLHPDGDLFLGAAATVVEAARDPRVEAFAGAALCAALADCARRLARPAATLGGQLCQGGRCGDLAPVLLVLDAECLIADEQDTAVMPLSAFYRRGGGTNLGDRLLVGLMLPRTSRLRRCRSYRHARFPDGRALAQVAVGLDVVENLIVNLRIAVGGATAAPQRALLAEAILTGLDPRCLGAAEVQQCAETVAAEVTPIDDHRASGDYRRDMVTILARRLLSQALARQDDEEPDLSA